MSSRYDRLIESGLTPQIVFCVEGCSRLGNTTKRDGKRVMCGHYHRSKIAARKCAKKMRISRPGNCQDYRVVEIHRFRIKRPRHD